MVIIIIIIIIFIFDSWTKKNTAHRNQVYHNHMNTHTHTNQWIVKNWIKEREKNDNVVHIYSSHSISCFRFFKKKYACMLLSYCSMVQCNNKTNKTKLNRIEQKTENKCIHICIHTFKFLLIFRQVLVL